MIRIAKFNKIPIEQFEADLRSTFPKYQWTEREIQEIYDGIQLPTRATVGSAGYDFYMPFPITLCSGEKVTIPTGIQVSIEDGYTLILAPRSSACRTSMALSDTIGVVDSDYIESDNHGHIFFVLELPIAYTSLGNSRTFNYGSENDYIGEQTIVTFDTGDRFAQGVLVPFGITTDDDTTQTRNGGFGSTDTETSPLDSLKDIQIVPVDELPDLTDADEKDYVNKIYQLTTDNGAAGFTISFYIVGKNTDGTLKWELKKLTLNNTTEDTTDPDPTDPGDSTEEEEESVMITAYRGDKNDWNDLIWDQITIPVTYLSDPPENTIIERVDELPTTSDQDKYYFTNRIFVKNSDIPQQTEESEDEGVEDTGMDGD